MPVAAKAWYDLSWDQSLGVLGTVLTLVGLGLAWWQAKKARGAAEAARYAVQQTQQQIVAKQLQLLLYQLRWVVGEIDRAIQAEQPDLAKTFLDNWRVQASQIHGMLSGTRIAEVELQQALTQSVTLAKIASQNLMSSSKDPLVRRCSRAQAAIGTAADLVLMWAGENATQVSIGEV